MSTTTHTPAGVRVGAALLTLLLAAACTEDFALPPNDPTGPGLDLRLEVHPLRAQGAPGDRVFLEARVVDAQGQAQEGYEVNWNQSTPGVAVLVSREGRATAYFTGIGEDTLFVDAAGLRSQVILTGVGCLEGSRNYPCN